MTNKFRFLIIGTMTYYLILSALGMLMVKIYNKTETINVNILLIFLFIMVFGHLLIMIFMPRIYDSY